MGWKRLAERSEAITERVIGRQQELIGAWAVAQDGWRSCESHLQFLLGSAPGTPSAPTPEGFYAFPAPESFDLIPTPDAGKEYDLSPPEVAAGSVRL